FRSPLAATAGVNLGFHHRRARFQLAERVWQFLHRFGGIAVRHGNAIGCKKFFGLIFVNIHRFVRCAAKSGSAKSERKSDAMKNLLASEGQAVDGRDQPPSLQEPLSGWKRES